MKPQLTFSPPKQCMMAIFHVADRCTCLCILQGTLCLNAERKPTFCVCLANLLSVYNPGPPGGLPKVRVTSTNHIAPAP